MSTSSPDGAPRRARLPQHLHLANGHHAARDLWPAAVPPQPARAPGTAAAATDEHATLEAANATVQPLHLVGRDRHARLGGCSGACMQLRRECDCPARFRPLLWRDIPAPWRVRILCGAITLAAVAGAAFLALAQ